ncbi:MAG: cardiolipin synthase [Bacteroidales bacterium]|nr:cardiolipin synthase [Bacteroidales bacterium]
MGIEADKMTLIPDFSFTSIQWVLSILYLVTILFICLMIIFQNKAPVKTLSWVLVILLIPFVGILIYIFFGQDYRKQKIFSRKGLKNLVRISDHAALQKVSVDEILMAESDEVRSKSHIIKLMLNNDNAILTRHNHIDILLDGDQTFPAMLDSIRNAKRFIHMQFYRFEFDELGREFISVLEEKAALGVEVRIIFDDVGSWNFPSSTIKEMMKSGVKLHPFMPVRFPHLTNKINYRNHRKILVVDGNHGFIGGLNLARKYLFGLKDLGQWRDTHLRITGEAVASLNSVFLTDWYFVSGEVPIPEADYFKTDLKYPKCLVQVTSCGPDSDWASIMQVYFASIATAVKRILIATPYFSPDDSILTALKTSSLSGTEVMMLLPARADSSIADWNTKSYISELIEAGIRVFLFNKGFNHSKYMVVDDVLSVVGSANVDMRSFDLNFEVAALIYDKGFAGSLTEVFFNDLGNARKIEAEEWESRRKISRYKESLARILGPLY